MMPVITITVKSQNSYISSAKNYSQDWEALFRYLMSIIILIKKGQ
jgi:hypothetical protein